VEQIKKLSEVVGCPRKFARRNNVQLNQVRLWLDSQYLMIDSHAYHRLRNVKISEEEPVPLIIHIRQHYKTQLAFSYAMDVLPSQVARWVSNNYIVYKKELLRYRRELKLA